MLNIYILPTDLVTKEDMSDLLEQFLSHMILLGELDAHNPLWESTKISIRWKILDRFNLLCLNEKEETYYKAYNDCKLTIDLTLANLPITPEYKWSKEYKLRGSDHFPIIIEGEREVSIKQNQR